MKKVSYLKEVKKKGDEYNITRTLTRALRDARDGNCHSAFIITKNNSGNFNTYISSTMSKHESVGCLVDLMLQILN